MSDLISRQDAIARIDKMDIPEDMCVFEILSHIELEIGTMPSAERKGKWISYIDYDGYVECPFCGSATNCGSTEEAEALHYCFNCGARMVSE